MLVVIGGSFNPVTKAHILMYEYLKKKTKFFKFCFLPVSVKYSKNGLLSNTHRFNMLKIATAKYSNIDVSDLEINSNKYLGTYISLCLLKKQYKKEVFFVIGADNLKYIKDWLNVDKLLSEFKFIVLNRANQDIEAYIDNSVLLSKYKDSFTIFADFNVNSSSTLFRDTYNNDLLDKDVFEYIENNSLYK